MQALKSTKEIAQIFGIPERRVRDLCNARGQKFAVRLTKPKGKFYIDPDLFERFLKERRLA